jgi:glyoxylase-like metal-dependent hydrolase (beta-lactamase superfamily II)
MRELMFLETEQRVIHDLGEGLFFIERGWLNGNHLVYAGEPVTLIDTAYRKYLADTKRLIEQCGVELTAVEQIITTHSHCDHIGAHRFIQSVSGARILTHPITRSFIQTENAYATWWDYYDQEADFFPVHGALDEGDEIAFGPFRWFVLHTPGHGAGMICLYEPDRKWLISADALWESDLGTLTPRIEGMDAAWRALDSVAKLAGLEVELVLPGHGAPFRDFQGAVQRVAARLRDFRDVPANMGRDQIKKILVFVIMMKGGLPVKGLLDYLMDVPWYPDTVDLFFDSRYQETLSEIVGELTGRGILYEQNDKYLTTIKP